MDDKAVDELKRTREKYYKELTEVGRSLRAVNQEQQLASQIEGLESRIKYSNLDLNLTAEKMEKNREEFNILNAELKKLNPQMKKVMKSKSF